MGGGDGAVPLRIEVTGAEAPAPERDNWLCAGCVAVNAGGVAAAATPAPDTRGVPSELRGGCVGLSRTPFVRPLGERQATAGMSPFQRLDAVAAEVRLRDAAFAGRCAKLRTTVSAAIKGGDGRRRRSSSEGAAEVPTPKRAAIAAPDSDEMMVAAFAPAPRVARTPPPCFG